jgi:hypothetical protein
MGSGTAGVSGGVGAESGNEQLPIANDTATGQANTQADQAGRQPGVGTGNGAGSKATQFKLKHPDRPGSRRTKPPAGAAKPSQLLRDMRFVYKYGESRDRTHGHRYCRWWLEDDPKGFLRKLADLEEALAARQR